MNLAITGSKGFIGYHLYNSIKYKNDDITLLDFESSDFNNPQLIDNILSSVDVLVHLAGINRSDSEKLLYDTNVSLSQQIADSAERVNFKGKIVFASSTMENEGNVYGKSKKMSKKILRDCSEKINFSFNSVIIPNVFGPFCKPNYNSFISTFCNNLILSKKNQIIEDKSVKLIYINSLIQELIKIIYEDSNEDITLKEDYLIRVSEVKKKLDIFYDQYYLKNQIPAINSDFEKNLFITFQSYIDYRTYYPKKNILNSDHRGNFSEIIRSESKGQSSFSETLPGKTRGNHFHTRKIERFTVIKGSALIEIRKIGSNEKVSFTISDKSPVFVDMKVWHTHNIKNIGDDNLITFFWINEFYNNEDSDTFFEKV